jgi:hypothetical protein
MDIAIGLVLLFAGVWETLDRTSLGVIWIVLWLPLMTAAKRSITMPRMRGVDFRPAPAGPRRVKLFAVTAVLGAATLLTLGLQVFAKVDLLPSWLISWFREYGRVAWPAVLAGLGALIGWATGVKRLHGYAALLLVGFACGSWFELAPAVVLMVLGGVILLTGTALLIRFVRRVPLADSSG